MAQVLNAIFSCSNNQQGERVWYCWKRTRRNLNSQIWGNIFKKIFGGTEL